LTASQRTASTQSPAGRICACRDKRSGSHRSFRAAAPPRESRGRERRGRRESRGGGPRLRSRASRSRRQRGGASRGVSRRLCQSGDRANGGAEASESAPVCRSGRATCRSVMAAQHVLHLRARTARATDRSSLGPGCEACSPIAQLLLLLLLLLSNGAKGRAFASEQGGHHHHLVDNQEEMTYRNGNCLLRRETN